MLFAIPVLTIGCISFILAREGQGVPRPDGPRARSRAREWACCCCPSRWRPP